MWWRQMQLVRCYQSGQGVYGYRPRASNITSSVSKEDLQSRNRQSNFYRWVQAYREHGHKKATVNPVAVKKPSHVPELRSEIYGLTEEETFNYSGILEAPNGKGTLNETRSYLDAIYTNKIGAEFSYLESEEEREWFWRNFERIQLEPLPSKTRTRIARAMLHSQTWDRFLATKFVTLKRYGNEGAEASTAFFVELLHTAAKYGLTQLIIGMPHRGRLNLLTGQLNFPPEKLFRKIMGYPEFSENMLFSGDINSHFTSSTDLVFDGHTLHVTLLYNPSHLEAVNSVSMGKTRGRQQTLLEGDYSKNFDSGWSDRVLNLQVHGDAALAGQGVNQESLALSRVPHFEVGGSLHLVTNNQIGFTTPAERGRSSRYCTDVAKSILAPVIHVNGDYPEMIARATWLALDYQRRFRKDIFVDINCFRRWGHNELDDPTMTNPDIYSIIDSRRSVPDEYADRLVSEGLLSQEDIKEISNTYTEELNKALKRTETFKPMVNYLQGEWSGIVQAEEAVTVWGTGVDRETLRYIGYESVKVPEDFNVHANVFKTHVKSRETRMQSNTITVDWSTAEAMAFGSLMLQGHHVRISGQDIGRGTFSHRHVMLVDQKDGKIHIPLNNLNCEGRLEVANSILSEEAVLGFEYGMAIENPSRLHIWEAQFGDFFNGAQIQIDTFFSSGESKWLQCCGLVMLLPHGLDGAGPEHSSARIERFLQITDSSETKPDGDSVNFHVVNPTTPAQYFHLLRRQLVRNFRKPLVVISPKIILRLPEAVSDLSELEPGTYFKPVIGDDTFSDKDAVEKVTRVILVSGKHYYPLVKMRQELKAKDVALVRVESLAPFPTQELHKELDRYKKAKVFVWSQEEHRNSGAWSFIKPRFENLVGRKIRYSGRKELATTSVGIGQWHQREAHEVLSKPFTC